MGVAAEADALLPLRPRTPSARSSVSSAHSPQNPVDETLATADRLIAETGARNLTPLVLLERAASPAWAENGAMRRALLDRRLLAGAT